MISEALLTELTGGNSSELLEAKATEFFELARYWYPQALAEPQLDAGTWAAIREKTVNPDPILSEADILAIQGLVERAVEIHNVGDIYSAAALVDFGQTLPSQMVITPQTEQERRVRDAALVSWAGFMHAGDADAMYGLITTGVLG